MKCISSHKAGYVLFLILLLLVAACSQVDQFPDDVQKEVFPANAIEEKNNLRGPEPTPTATSVTTNASVTVTPPEVALFLPDMGLAPEIENEIWLNSEPLRLGDLRGKVVMVEFWTFGCINCKRVLPYLNEWQARYAGDDFVIISVHYPEFGYEEKIENVRAAV